MGRWMETRWRSATLLVFVTAFLVLALAMDREVNMFDEGLVLSDAVRTLHGDILHRDFHTPYGPGSSYVLAGLFALDRHWFLIARLFSLLVQAAIVALTFALLIGRVRLWLALLFTAVCGAWIVGALTYLYPLYPALLCAMLGCIALLRRFAGGGAGHALAAGAAATGAALFRYDAGGFLVIAYLAAIALRLSLARAEGYRPAAALRDAGLCVIGALASFAPFAIAFAAVAPIGAFVTDYLDYAVKYYASMRAMPFPRLPEVLRHPGRGGVYVPVLVFGLWLWDLVRERAQPGEGAERRTERDMLLVFGTVFTIFYYKGLVRVSTLHMLMSVLPAGLVLALLAERLFRRGGGARLVAAAAIALVVLPSAASAAGQLLTLWFNQRFAFLTPRVVPSCPTPARMWPALMSRDYERIGGMISHYSAPGEPIFVGLDRHDTTFANPVTLYVIADRPPMTYWHQFDPGLQNRADVQAGMVAEFARQAPRWAVRDANFSDFNEPNASSISSGVHLLDRWLDTHYRPVARSGKVALWLRNDVPAPPLTGSFCLGER